MNAINNFENSEELAREVRFHAINMVHRSNSSHIGSAFSITDIISVLYQKHLNISPDLVNNPGRDIFILSKGHACVSLYALLALKGYFDIDLLNTYSQDDSSLMAHISHKTNGVEFSTGSLGHGLPFAVGKALASKMLSIKNKVYVVIGDGECAEGSNWEALLFAAHHKLDNLVVIVDNNNLQSFTTVDRTMNIEPLEDKFKAFNCNVYKVDGHNHIELNLLFNKIKIKSGLPNIIIAKTIKGKGVSFMENTVKWHYSSPNQEELLNALNQINNA